MLSTSLFLAGSALAARTLISQTRLPSNYLHSFEETCKFSGFNCTSHQITTKDGYLLTLFKVSSQFSERKKPVLMVHGLTSSAFSYIACKSNLAPAFRLASAGYDVWLLNTRGNRFSCSHKTMEPTQKKFWDWTAYHISVYDLPSSIEYILSNSSSEKLHYVGHSQGGHVLLTLLSLVPEYNKKIALASLLTPVGGTICANTNFFKTILNKETIDHVEKSRFYHPIPFDSDSIKIKFMYEFPEIGKYLMKDRYDVGYTNDDPAHLSYYALKLADCTSLTNLRYYRQLKLRNQVIPEAFDYDDSDLNLKVYGSKSPPIIDFSKINTNLALFFGTYDKVVSPNDGAQLLSVLNKDIVVFKDTDWKLDHGGFVLSNNQSHFEKIVEFMDKY